VGAGRGNTAKIIAYYGSGNYAAKACVEYSAGLYADWFLPSLDELKLMYANLGTKGIGDFAQDMYWSSTDNGNQWARCLDFSDGIVPYVVKDGYGMRVRPVRVF